MVRLRNSSIGTLGLQVVRSTLAITLPVDCHLLIDNPGRWAIGHAEAVWPNTTVPADAMHDPVATAKRICRRPTRRSNEHPP